MALFMTSATNLSSSLLAQDMQVRFSFIVSLKQNFQIKKDKKDKALVGTLKVYMKRREIQKMINNIIVLFWNKLEYKREKKDRF